MDEKKENVNTALFTASIAVLLVCLKRALLLFLFQQWRAWVFVVLNLVLLAIFFTSSSMNPNATQTSDRETTKKNDEEMKKKRGDVNEVEACKEDYDEVIEPKKRSKSKEVEEIVEKKLVVEEDIEPSKLSDEELNERVEAFIATFRQHLASDARKGRKQAGFNKKKHINLSSDGVNCLVLKVK